MFLVYHGPLLTVWPLYLNWNAENVGSKRQQLVKLMQLSSLFISQLAAGASAQSTNIRSRQLVVDLRAADFNNATGQWDNRATVRACVR